MQVDQETMINTIAENADRLCTLELRARGYSHGVILPLYQAAREELGEPLAMAAAKRLHASVSRGDVVLLTTGAGSPLHMPCGETDGPLGTVAVARMLAEGLGAVPVIVTEPAYVDNVVATALGVGLAVRSIEEARQVPGTVVVLPFPAEEDEAKAAAQDLFAQLDPKAVVAIEKLGPNAVGVTHSATGRPLDTERARAEHLVAVAAEKGILTIGVGDNGNEIGFGRIKEAVWEHKPFGRVCQCPCGEGLATVVATDVLVVAGTSNWGAYAVEACLAALIERPELIHSAHAEQFMLEQNVIHGGLDGSTGRAVPQVDGTSLAVQIAFNELFRAIVVNCSAPPTNRGF